MADAPTGTPKTSAEAPASDDAKRLTRIAKQLADRDVPPELTPPLAACIFDARIACADDLDTPWAQYAKAANDAIGALGRLAGWLEDASPSARSRDLYALDCVVEDDSGEMALVAHEETRRRSLLATLVNTMEPLRPIAEALGATSAPQVWALLRPPSRVWSQLLRARHPPAHVVAFIAYEIAHAHGHIPHGKRTRSPNRIADAAHAVFARDGASEERGTSSASVAVSQVRGTLNAVGWTDAEARREALTSRYWKRAAALRALHGDTLFDPWPTDAAALWLARSAAVTLVSDPERS